MVTFHKVVGSLPGTPEPDAFYCVRVGDGFDLWLTSSEGVPFLLNGGTSTPPEQVAPTLSGGSLEVVENA